MSVVLKISLNQDLRRLSIPSSTSYNLVLDHVRKMFGLAETSHIVLKYTDDEGDLVSITSQDELLEAFRVCGVLRPPILRVSVSVGSAPAIVPKEVETEPLYVASLEPFLAKTQPPSQPTEPREYPPLDVSLWSAPEKTVLASSPPQRISSPVEEPKPRIKIGQQMRQECLRTSGEVNRISKEVRLETLKVADIQCAESLRLASQQRATSLLTADDMTNLMKEKDPTALLCSSLSKQIMEECKRLSQETAKLSSQLADLQRERIVKNEQSIAKEVSDLCRQTATMCRELCAATAAISE